MAIDMAYLNILEIIFFTSCCMINSSKNGRFATFVHDLCPASLVFLSSEHYLCTAVQRYAKLLDYAFPTGEINSFYNFKR